MVTAATTQKLNMLGPRTIRRKPRACDTCYLRKIRCDEEDGACQNCVKYGRRCILTSSNGTRHVRGNEDMPESSEKKPVDRRKRRKLTQPTASSPARNTVADQLLDWDNIQALSPASNSGTTGGPLGIDKVDVEDTSPAARSIHSTGLSSGIEGVVIIEPFVDDPQKCKYVGKTSSQVLAKSAEDLCKPDGFDLGVMLFYCPLMSHAEEIFPLSAPMHMPLINYDHALLAVNAFFETIPRLFSFLDEAHFRRAFETFHRDGGSDDSVTVCCIYLVISIGMRQYKDQTALSQKHFSTAWSLYNHVMATPYLQSVQCLILMTLELMNQNKEGQALLTIGTALRIAQSLGMHRALSSHIEMIELEFVSKNYVLRSSIWWTCYCLDKKLAFEYGRLSIINDMDCDVDDNSTFLHNLSPGDNSQLDSHSSAFAHMIRLCQILSMMMTRLFSKSSNPHTEQALLAQIALIDGMLVKWKDDLPEAWRLDLELLGADDHLHDMVRLVLHSAYFNAMLVLHRAGLFGTLAADCQDQIRGRVASSNIICLSAARSLSKCLNVLSSSIVSWAFLRWLATYCLNVTFTLFVGTMRDPHHWSVEGDIGIMKSSTRCFTAANSNKFAVQPFSRLVQILLQAMESKRQRISASDTAFEVSGLADNRHSHDSASGCTSDGQLISHDRVHDADMTLSQEQYLDSSLQLHRFFDFGDAANVFDITQLWPVELHSGSDEDCG